MIENVGNDFAIDVLVIELKKPIDLNRYARPR